MALFNAKMAEVVKRGSDGIMVPVPPGKAFSQIARRLI